MIRIFVQLSWCLKIGANVRANVRFGVCVTCRVRVRVRVRIRVRCFRVPSSSLSAFARINSRYAYGLGLGLGLAFGSGSGLGIVALLNLWTTARSGQLLAVGGIRWHQSHITVR